MSKALKLYCAAYPHDHITVQDANSCILLRAVNVNVTLLDETKETPVSIRLTADDARTLFNWLGVWLHGGNRT